MKTKGQKLLTIMLVTCVLAGSAANSFAKLGHEQKSLIGIESIVVSVSCSETAAKETGLKKEDIREDVAAKLEQAGIKIIPEYMYGPPRLHIRIKAYKIPNQEIFVDDIGVFFKQKVALVNHPEEKIIAYTWELSWLSHTSSRRFVKHIQEHIKIIIDSFIRDYRQANPPGKQTSDGRTSETDSLTATEKQTKPAAKSAVAGYGYVASKNSKVFHRPNCRSAKRINPENLVGYNSKDEAMKAGKRPCKVCKP